jgi:hypothetical protein
MNHTVASKYDVQDLSPKRKRSNNVGWMNVVVFETTYSYATRANIHVLRTTN